MKAENRAVAYWKYYLIVFKICGIPVKVHLFATNTLIIMRWHLNMLKMCNIKKTILLLLLQLMGNLRHRKSYFVFFSPCLALLSTDWGWDDSVYSPRQNLNPSLHCACVCVCVHSVYKLLNLPCSWKRTWQRGNKERMKRELYCKLQHWPKGVLSFTQWKLSVEHKPLGIELRVISLIVQVFFLLVQRTLNTFLHWGTAFEERRLCFILPPLAS